MVNSTIQSDIELKVRERLTQILQYFDLAADISLAVDEGVLTLNVETGRDDLFTRGAADPLLALQHILRVITRHDFPGQTTTLSLNIGGFQQHQRARLAQIAQNAAQQARATKMAVYLSPMSSYERRLVHVALVDEVGVSSESEGEGEDRRVVVKPAECPVRN